MDGCPARLTPLEKFVRGSLTSSKINSVWTRALVLSAMSSYGIL